eukprot:jgi/Mesen1/6216/ME000320S05416
MSLGYAEKLSYREDVGTVGTAEFFDPPNVVQSKSKRVVAFTGAGISTSCGIPDFRGPAGIWTLQKEGRPLPRAGTQFAAACPGVCHMAIVELLRVGLMHFVISQVTPAANLPLRAGQHGGRFVIVNLQVDFPGCPGLAGAHLTQQPFTLTREVEEEEEEPSCVKLTLHFGGGSSSMLPCAEVTHALSGACETMSYLESAAREAGVAGQVGILGIKAAEGVTEYGVVTMVVPYASSDTDFERVDGHGGVSDAEASPSRHKRLQNLSLEEENGSSGRTGGGKRRMG